MKTALNIVSFDVPFPADYGGAIDVFYKIRSLAEAGVSIHLHCFVHHRPPHNELDKYCASVHYYDRKTGHKGFSHKIPYIVCSRTSEQLVNALEKNNFPILLEGVHTSGILQEKKLKNRQFIIRLHNAEFEYYRQLARYEKNILKKIYYYTESILLKKYEAFISTQPYILALSPKDIESYKNAFNNTQIKLIPAFHGNTTNNTLRGLGSFCLFHANLSVNENEQSAIWLLEKVFSKIKFPIVIAGKQPSKKLLSIAEKIPNACIVPDPSEGEMQDLVLKSQLSLIPILNTAGIKIKLINSLFNGRHCISDRNAIACPFLAQLCVHAKSAEDYIHLIGELFNKPVSDSEISQRTAVLNQYYSNADNADKILRLLC